MADLSKEDAEMLAIVAAEKAKKLDKEAIRLDPGAHDMHHDDRKMLHEIRSRLRAAAYTRSLAALS